MIKILLNCNAVQLNQLNLIPKVAKMQDCLTKSIKFDIKNKMQYCSTKSIKFEQNIAKMQYCLTKSIKFDIKRTKHAIHFN